MAALHIHWRPFTECYVYNRSAKIPVSNCFSVFKNRHPSVPLTTKETGYICRRLAPSVPLLSWKCHSVKASFNFDLDTTLPRDRILDFGAHKGKRLGAIPPRYLKWIVKEGKKPDFDKVEVFNKDGDLVDNPLDYWALAAEKVLSDPLYRDRIEWEEVWGESKMEEAHLWREKEKIFGWVERDDREAWRGVDYRLLGTSFTKPIPRVGYGGRTAKVKLQRNKGSVKKVILPGPENDAERRRALRRTRRLQAKEGELLVGDKREEVLVSSGEESRVRGVKDGSLSNNFADKSSDNFSSNKVSEKFSESSSGTVTISRFPGRRNLLSRVAEMQIEVEDTEKVEKEIESQEESKAGMEAQMNLLAKNELVDLVRMEAIGGGRGRGKLGGGGGGEKSSEGSSGRKTRISKVESQSGKDSGTKNYGKFPGKQDNIVREINKTNDSEENLFSSNYTKFLNVRETSSIVDKRVSHFVEGDLGGKLNSTSLGGKGVRDFSNKFSNHVEFPSNVAEGEGEEAKSPRRHRSVLTSPSTTDEDVKDVSGGPKKVRKSRKKEINGESEGKTAGPKGLKRIRELEMVENLWNR